MNVTPEKFLYLLEANRALSSTLNLPELLRQVMTFATGVVDAETSSLLLYDESCQELYFDLALGDKESQLKQIRLKVGEGIAGCAAAEKAPLLVNDVAADKRWTSRADGATSFTTRSILAVPMLYRGRLLGVVEAINKRSGGFTEEDVSALEAFTAQAAVSIENARNFEKLQEENNKIEAVFSQMSDGAIFVDARGNKLLVNAAAEKLLGSENTVKGTIEEILAGFSVNPPLERLFSGEERSVLLGWSRAGDKTLYLDGVSTAISDAAGNLTGCILLFRDVTAEKKESYLKRDFLSLMSHKLKTPLVSIIGYGQLLLADDSLSDFPKKAVTSITRQGNHLSALVEKLLTFTIIESEEIVLSKEEESFATLLGRSLAALKPFLEEKKAQVTVSPRVGELTKLFLDGEKVEIALRNVVENAVKFNPGPQKDVLIDACRGDGFAGLAVKDNGPGIPPEEREKIFQKFYQIEESFTGQVEGVGLGLALVKRIVEAHGGKVSLESVLGAGSTFSLLFPEVLHG